MILGWNSEGTIEAVRQGGSTPGLEGDSIDWRFSSGGWLKVNFGGNRPYVLARRRVWIAGGLLREIGTYVCLIVGRKRAAPNAKCMKEYQHSGQHHSRAKSDHQLYASVSTSHLWTADQTGAVLSNAGSGHVFSTREYVRKSHGLNGEDIASRQITVCAEW